MNKKILATFLLVAFITLAVFGLYLVPMGHMGHDMPCPFAAGGTALCSMTLVHIEHWQSSFLGVLLEILVLAAIALMFVVRFAPDTGKDPQFERYRLRQRIPMRPPLLQELFSQGILHRKEPHMLSLSY